MDILAQVIGPVSGAWKTKKGLAVIPHLEMESDARPFFPDMWLVSLLNDHEPCHAGTGAARRGPASRVITAMEVVGPGRGEGDGLGPGIVVLDAGSAPVVDIEGMGTAPQHEGNSVAVSDGDRRGVEGIAGGGGDQS